MSRDQLIEALRGYFSSQPCVCTTYLFGSYAKGLAHAASDVDIALLLAGGCSPQEALLQQLFRHFGRPGL